MKTVSDDRISEIIREEINALDFFNGLNARSGGLTPWDASTKMERMGPSRAACAQGTIPTRDIKFHSYDDWVRNYKPKGISYKEYMEIPFY